VLSGMSWLPGSTVAAAGRWTPSEGGVCGFLGDIKAGCGGCLPSKKSSNSSIVLRKPANDSPTGVGVVSLCNGPCIDMRHIPDSAGLCFAVISWARPPTCAAKALAWARPRRQTQQLPQPIHIQCGQPARRSGNRLSRHAPSATQQMPTDESDAGQMQVR